MINVIFQAETRDKWDVRLLRGGSGGGGGGGSSSSGGGYYYGGSYGGRNYGGGSSGGDLPAGVAWAIGGTLLVLFVIACGYFFETAKRKERQKAQEFDDAIIEARSKGDSMKSKELPSCVKYRTYNATFDTEYTDRSNTLTGELELSLENDTCSGYSISGQGSDADGKTQVKDGFVSYSGEAWWLEEVVSPGADFGMRILSQGEFDLDKNSFVGTWRSSSTYGGKYTSFVGRKVVKTLEQSMPVAYAKVEEEIPVAFAMEEIPAVTATPEPTAPALK